MSEQNTLWFSDLLVLLWWHREAAMLEVTPEPFPSVQRGGRELIPEQHWHPLLSHPSQQ